MKPVAAAAAVATAAPHIFFYLSLVISLVGVNSNITFTDSQSKERALNMRDVEIFGKQTNFAVTTAAALHGVNLKMCIFKQSM